MGLMLICAIWPFIILVPITTSFGFGLFVFLVIDKTQKGFWLGTVLGFIVGVIIGLILYFWAH